ncbi:retrovirus-related pol polyprotein from transposon TNT 1-94 [Tanacetum coccineum]
MVPPKKPGQTKAIKKTPPSSVSQGKPNETKTVSSSSKPNIVESRISNNPEPNKNWISNVSNSPSSSRVQCRSYRSSFVAFQKHTSFVRDLEGVDLLTGSRGTNLYTLSLEDMMKSSPICLLSKASKTKAWLWHRRLSHLNFGTINQLAKQGLIRGLPKLKYEKDHLCSACSLGKSKKHTHKPKSKDSIQEKLFTWVKFLRSKDETPEFIIKFLTQVQVRLNSTFRNIQTDNGTEFVNQKLKSYHEDFGVTHQTSVTHTLQQNNVVKRKNWTLVEVARTMLIFSKAPLFLWAEAVATTCYTQNRSLICSCHNKTPYELLHVRKPNLKYLHVFGALCYPTNNSEDLGKLKPKADIGIFIGYSPAKKAYRIYNRWTRLIMETIHVEFDKLTSMASKQFSSGHAPQFMTPRSISLGLVQNPSSSTPYVPPSKKDWDILLETQFHSTIRNHLAKLIWNSIQNGPSPHPMITDAPAAGQTGVNMPRMKLDSEFAPEETNRENADTQAEIILSQGLPRHIFNILNQTNTTKEIWDNVEMLMQGSGRTLQQRKEDLFDEFERFRAIGNEPIHDYFVRFHKLVNDMKITQLDIPTHQLNTKFVNNLPSYWGKYVTNVKQNMDISTTNYVHIYTHLKAYEPHANKTLKKQEKSSSIIDPLAYMAQATPTTSLPPLSTSQPQPAVLSLNDAMMATMTQIANLLSGFQKQFPPTNNQLRSSSNSRTHATVHDGQIVTETVQRRAPGNVGNTGSRGNQSYGNVTTATGKKMLLMEAKEKGVTLDAEAEAFLANVECTAPYDQPLAMATTNIFEVNHEDAYDSVDEGPNAAAAFMANLSSTSGNNHHVNELDDNTTPYHQLELERRAKVVPTEENQDLSLENQHLKAEIAKCKLEIVRLDTQQENQGHLRPANVASMRTLNAICLVPQTNLPREQANGLPANEIASQASTTIRHLLLLMYLKSAS